MKNREQRQQQQTLAYVDWFKTFGVGVRGIENFSDLKQAFEAGYNAGYRLGMIDGKDFENIPIRKSREENSNEFVEQILRTIIDYVGVVPSEENNVRMILRGYLAPDN